MADHQEVTLTLPSAPVSVPAARRFARQVLSSWGLDETGGTAGALLLMVSEPATNAVQHTRGQSPVFTLDVRLERHARLRIGVTDGHPRWPRRLPAAVQQDNGRGLGIIRTPAAEAGVRMSVTPTDEGGKTVWITLPWPAPGPASG
ncbi:ATP-binding protein [Streptomyces sp. NPDC048718]|uniref:ATP-binding protein n=1 Tax=Streptomyces sp. NPDC048718 TaxID=3365587 RepID=UPI003716E507